MAEKIESKGTERLYTINLRSEWLKVPRSMRTKKSIRVIKAYVEKHTKSKEIRISKGINELIMKRGFKKPPGKITVEVKGDLEKMQVKLPGEVIIGKKPEKPKGGMAGLKDRLLAEKTDQGAAPITKKELKETIKKKVEEETTKEKVKEIAERVKKEAEAKEEPKTEEKKEEPKKEIKKKETPKESKETKEKK
jgi:ribosomal protein L31E